ncbi:hypothetical protein CWB73_05395 [Pseudoalteromonas phenolica]|uniref:TIGR02646 family protein n=1 Tax=Pseudoalteromonas phenolica TaxID=161398 RepID=A0A5S3YWT9_9GAMM|nr:hypothetical protein [Pseudoalteromonas phenolica]TMP81836.1 hypothetical protein CWB73_05395 [Pseudoalteromonas phenolica]
MNFIEFPEDLPENIEAWVERAEEITDEILEADTLQAKHDLIDRYKNHWRNTDLIKWLSDMSHTKCWYTETYFGGDYQELEHFRPKKGTKLKDRDHPTHSGYYWLAFDLSNYRLCKGRPNRKKGTFFPLLEERFRAAEPSHAWEDELPLFLDPLVEEDTLLLSFNDDGSPCPEIDLEEDDIDRVEFTIEKYFLDETTLNTRRKVVWDTARSLYNEYLNLAKNRRSVSARQDAKAKLNELKSLMLPNKEFSSVAKASLLKLGENMARKIASS